jgi:hypothetical protein
MHKKRLQQIKNKCPRSFSVIKLQRKPKTIISNEILDNNRKLVQRLIEIANHKQNYAPLLPSTPTLNYLNRKREFERIDAENKRLLSKIQNCCGDVRSESLEKNFCASQAYKSRISRSVILRKRSLAQSKSEKAFLAERSSKNCMPAISLINAES